jgi:transcriptional regulator with XRE-family HTH domain
MTEPFAWSEGNRIIETLGSEAHLSTRIARERAAREWSQSELAREMALVGCPIPQTAISKIEKPQKGSLRAITVDEAIAFAKVFDIPFGELFLPTDVLASIANARLMEAAHARVQARANTEREYLDCVHDVALAAFKDPELSRQLDEQWEALGLDPNVRHRKRSGEEGANWREFLGKVRDSIHTMDERFPAARKRARS